MVGDDRAQASHAEPVALRGGTPRRILVAEDNRVNQVLVTRILQEARAHHRSRRKRNQVIAALSRESFDPCSWTQMPEMSGLEATAEIRARERKTGGHVPTVAVTAHARSGDRERFVEAGMDGYLSKPLNAAELLHTVEELTGNRHGAELVLLSSGGDA